MNGDGNGVLTISDTTVVGNPGGGEPQVNGIASDSGLVARRCDVSQTGDGIHMVAQADINSAIISQCYIHDQAFVDEDQHCDGIQIFNHPSVQGFFTVEHTYVERSISTIGTPMNASMTCGTPTANGAPLATPIINNNFFESGLYHLRTNYRLHNSTVTNNDTGPLLPAEFGLWATESPIATWSNNHNADGSVAANPSPLTSPSVREVIQTTDNQLSAQTLTTGAGTTAGDTLLVVYMTDNNTASDPTSTAGTLTKIGTDVVDGNGNGILRAYTVSVATNGSKDVTMACPPADMTLWAP